MRARPTPVLWTSVARRDLEEIIAFVRADRPAAARRLLRRIEQRAATLGIHPQIGRVVPELKRLQIAAYRELMIPPYRLTYRAEVDRVLVLGIFDGRRNLEDILLARLLGS